MDLIESNLIRLMCKIQNNEERIDPYVQKNVISALQVYNKQIKEQSEYISDEKRFRLLDLIDEAEAAVRKLSIKKHTDNIEGEYNELEIKKYLLDTYKDLDNNHNVNYENLLEEITTGIRKIYGCGHNILDAGEEEDINCLFLTVFVRTPPMRATQRLELTNTRLNTAIKTIDDIDIQSVSPFDEKAIEETLQQLQQRVDDLCQLQTETQRSFTGKRIQRGNESLKMKTHLQYIKAKEQCDFLVKKLEKYHAIVETLRAPVKDENLEALQKEIETSFQRRLTEISEVGDTIRDSKKFINDRAMTILKELETINQTTKKISEHLKILQETETEAIEVVQQSADGEEKLNQLDQLKQKVFDIGDSGVEVMFKKVLNRVEGAIIFQIWQELQKINRNVVLQEQHSREFPFPKNFCNYEMKCREIEKMINKLDNLSKSYNHIHDRAEKLKERVNTVLTILQMKASNNQEIIDALRCIENLKTELGGAVADPSLEIRGHMKFFNNKRHEIKAVDGVFSDRVTAKKMEILNMLQSKEAEIFHEHPILHKIANTLKEYLNQFQKFAHPISENDFLIKRNEFLSFVEESKGSINSLYDPFVSSSFNESFNIVLQLLDKKFEEAKQIEDFLKCTEGIKNELNQQLTPEEYSSLLEKHETYISNINYVINHPKVITAIKEVKTQMSVKKSLTYLCELNTQLNDFKSALLVNPIPGDTFREKLDVLFSVLDAIEDMPHDDKDLNSQKRIVLSEVHSCMELLDKPLADLVSNRSQPEARLELTYFNFQFEDQNVCPNPTQYIDFIRERAKAFVPSINFYQGSNDSADFRHIRDTLLSLRKDLGKVKCGEDETLRALRVDSEKYITQLLKQLQNSAST